MRRASCARPKRTLSGDLDGLCLDDKKDKNWKNLDTVHKAKFADFDDSSLFDDSFAGSSFASTQDSFCCSDDSDVAKAQFTQLDDEPASAPAGGKPALPGVSPRKNTPRRTYSKQRKQMPKKSDPLMAITEDDDDEL